MAAIHRHGWYETAYLFLFIVIVLWNPLVAESFAVSPHHSVIFSSQQPRNSPSATVGSSTQCHALSDLGTNILLSVDVFDGSSIVDPVVVSSSFWGSLQRQLISVILGQVLAAIVFTVLASLFATQLSSLREFVMSKFLSDSNGAKKDFIRADSPEYKRATVSPDFGKLLICLAIDLAGSSSELIPLLGEFTDIVTAPLAATLLQSQFGGSKAVFFLEFAEEILPFTDVIPFATLCWVIDTYFPESDIAGVFQLGKFRVNEAFDRDAIDVTAERFQASSKTKSDK